MHELLNRRHSLFSAALALLLGLCAIILWRNWPSTAYFSGGTDLEYRLTGYIDASFDPDEAAGQLETIAAGALDRTVRVELLPADGGSCRLLVTASDGEELSYPEYLTLTNALINSFPGWVFTPMSGLSQSSVDAGQAFAGSALLTAAAVLVLTLFLMGRFRRIGGLAAGLAGAAGLLCDLVAAAAFAALAKLPLGSESLPAMLAVLAFGVYDTSAVLHETELRLGEGADPRAALAEALRSRLRFLIICTLTAGSAMLAVTSPGIWWELTRCCASRSRSPPVWQRRCSSRPFWPRSAGTSCASAGICSAARKNEICRGCKARRICSPEPDFLEKIPAPNGRSHRLWRRIFVGFLPKGRLFPPGGPGSLCNFSQISFIADGEMHGRLHFICRKRRSFYQVFPIIIEKGTNCLWLKTISHTKGFDGAIQVS